MPHDRLAADVTPNPLLEGVVAARQALVLAQMFRPAPSDTISHADPTPCMNVPMSETTSAISSRRKIGVRSGCHNPAAPGLRSDAGVRCTVLDITSQSVAGNSAR
jgi:hypothetical protein